MDSDYEEEDYSPMAEDVRQQGGGMPMQMPQQMPMRGAATSGWGAVGTMNYGMGRPQKAPQQVSPKMKEAEFYMNLGDFSSAESLLKSKGPAVFQRDEVWEVDSIDENGKPSKQAYMIGPRGEYQYTGPDGKPTKIPAYLLANRAGVGSVPFRGGDQSAIQFRTLMSKVQKFTRDLNDLEMLYRNNMYLGSLDPSEASARARMLEAGIKTDYLAIMKDTKGMGGAVSDNDMLIAEYMVPQRATNALTRLGGNELAILRQVRDGALRKVMELGSSNGISFRSQNQGRNGLHPYFEKGVIRNTAPDEQ